MQPSIRRPRSNHLRKAALIPLALTLMAAPAAGVWWFMRDANAATTVNVSEQLVTAIVSTQTFEQSVTGNGTLTPSLQESPSFTAQGRVLEVNVAVGDTVEPGTVLARIDKLALNSALANANAQLASANSALATANEQLTAAQESGSETATAQAQVTAKARAVDVARDNYQTARNNLDSAELVAEYDGLVTEVNIAVGDAVGASGAGGAGGTGSTRSDIAIINTDQWQLTVNVSEADVRQLSVGNQVEISGNTLAETAFGTVSEIALLPVASGQNVAFPVTVAITGTPNGLFDGVSMTAKIIYERRMNVMTVPAAAVTTAADGTRTVEVLAADGSITPVTITTGATSGQNLEVLTGLDGSETLQYTQITIERPSGSENRGGNGSPGGGQMPDFTQMPSGGQMPDFSQLPGGAGMTRPGGRG